MKEDNIFVRFSPYRGYQFLTNLIEHFGMRFFLMMCSGYIGIKGALHFFVKIVQLPYYKQAGLEGPIMQSNHAISNVPWTIKGFIGALSDLFPLFSYSKTSYLLIYTVLGTLGAVALTAMPLEVAHNNPNLPALFFFFIYLETAAHDLLIEGKAVQQMKLKSQTKGNVVTFAWLCALTGQILPGVVVGPVTDVTSVRYIFIPFIVIAIQPIPFLLSGCMIADKVPKELANRLDTKKFKSQWKAMTLALMMGTFGMGTLVVGLLTTSSLVNFIYNAFASITLATSSFYFVESSIAKYCLYFFASQTIYVDLKGALEYYYTADVECSTSSPHFSFTFIKTYGQVVGTFAQLLGIAVYQVILIRWKFRAIFWSTTIIRILASLFDLVLVNNYHRAIGIPDHVMYMLGNAVIYQLAYMMDWIPGIVMIAKVCPRDVESTVFAIVGSFGNYGINLSSFFGTFLMDAFNIKTLNDDQGECNFDNLSYLILVGHCLLPAFCIPMAFVLIPNKYVYESFISDKGNYAEEYKPHALPDQINTYDKKAPTVQT